jgi:hypothetical protein
MSFYNLWRKVEEHKAIKEHLGTSGIQRWSAGEIFPVRIQIIGSGPGRVQAIAPGGIVVADEEFESMKTDFPDVHRRVEDKAREYLHNR